MHRKPVTKKIFQLINIQSTKALITTLFNKDMHVFMYNNPEGCYSQTCNREITLKGSLCSNKHHVLQNTIISDNSYQYKYHNPFTSKKKDRIIHNRMEYGKKITYKINNSHYVQNLSFSIR
jgi:hypothetical protein